MERILAVLGISDEDLYRTEVTAGVESTATEPPTQQPSLAWAIDESKKRLAQIAGTTAEHIKIIIEV